MKYSTQHSLCNNKVVNWLDLQIKMDIEIKFNYFTNALEIINLALEQKVNCQLQLVDRKTEIFLFK